jgi:predicted nucleotidyltransferase
MASSSNSVERALARIAEELRAAQQSFALVGGLAVSARAEPRTTRDVDIAVSTANDEAAEQLIWRLQSSGYTVRTLLEQERTGRIATVRLVRQSERSVYVDLLFASSGIEPEVVAGAEEIELLDGVSLAVATRAHLIALKVLARDDRNRPQDWDDLRALLADASQGEVQEARDALQLIELRGFNRGRDLPADLSKAIAELVP